MKKLLIGALFLSLISVTGCAIDGTNANKEGQEGDLTLNLSPSGDVIYKSGQQGSELFETPDIADFKVLIFNSNNEQYASFAKFSEMPSPTRLKAGSYTLVASHGTNPPAAFNAPYFEGTAPFTIEGTGNTPLKLTCKIANVLVGVQYTDKFKAVFDNYSLDVMTEHTVNDEGGYEALRFVGDDARIGFVRVAPTVYLRVSLRKIDTNKKYEYGVTPLTDIKGGEYYKLVFDADARGNAVVNIILNDETQSKPLDVALGEEYLPKLAPAINTTFNAALPYSFRYGLFNSKTPMIAAMNVPGGIKNIVMEVNSEYASELGVPANIDFSVMTPETEAALLKLGIEWSKNIIGAKSGRVNFTKMLTTLDISLAAKESEHLFNVKVIDKYDREAFKEFSFEVLPLVLKMGAVNDYDIWAKHAKFGAAYLVDYTLEAQQKFPITYQVSVDGDAWTDLSAYTLDGGVVSATSLKDNTLYKVRAMTSGVFSEEIAFTTEEAKNVPNASFEENYQEKFASKTESIIYYPYAQGEANPFWQTLNPMTTRDKKENYYQSYPCALIVNDASHGTKAIKLQTTGWGGNAKAPLGSIPRPSSTTPGKLFIGDFVDSDDWSSGNRSMNQGKPFNSRPTSIDFDYKYAAYNTILGSTMQVRASIENRAADGTVTVLAKGSFDLRKSSQDLGDYKTQNMVLNYTNTQLKATHISLSFQCQEDKNIGITELYVNSDNGSKKTIGSYLFVDNIVLNY